MKDLQASTSVLELDSVTFRRGGRDIIDGVSLSVVAGEHWALLGANGAGKSTLMDLCGAKAHPSSGSVYVLGHRIGRVELRALRQSVGHVNPRHSAQGSLTVREIVLTGLMGSNELPKRWNPDRVQLEEANDLIEQFGLARKSGFRWENLSQGERGRVLIARALVTSPKLLLLDEPCTGLDVSGREQLLEALEHLAHSHPKLASVMVTHHLEELPSSTSHALLLADGHTVRSGPVNETLTTTAISSAFGCPLEIDFRFGRWTARSLRQLEFSQAAPA